MSNAIYANARAKALENGLLGSDRLNRMLDSSADDAIKILSEVNFGGGVQIDGFMSFETLISAEERKFIDFLKADSPSVAFKNYMLLPFDFHNAEAFIKEKYLKCKSDDFTVDGGTVDKDAMKEKIMLDEYKDFPDEMAKALITCDADFVSGKATGASVNAIFKKALYKELLTNARKNGDLKEIFTIKADCANVGIALRVRNFSAAKEYFVVGGKLSETELKLLCEESFEVIKEKCKFMSSGELISVAVDSCMKGEPLSAFETMADDFALKTLKKRKYDVGGIIPFMLYCYYKLAEIKNVRIVMVGLINGIDKNEIKRRLRDGYEG